MQPTVKPAKLSDMILERLEEMIIKGNLQAGEKLPAERELAAHFNVSRPSLREAIQKLEAKGLVTRKQGGGTFINTTMLAGFSDPLFELMANKTQSQFDLLEFRLGIEGMAAYYAAIRGTHENYTDIQKNFDAIELAQIENDHRLEAKAVYDFYLSICIASHNGVFLHLIRSMSELLIDNLAKNIVVLAKRPDVFDKIRSYRKQLMNAIVQGKAQKAWSISHNHLMFIEQVLIQQTHEQHSLQRSLRPMQRNSK